MEIIKTELARFFDGRDLAVETKKEMCYDCLNR